MLAIDWADTLNFVCMHIYEGLYHTLSQFDLNFRTVTVVSFCWMPIRFFQLSYKALHLSDRMPHQSVGGRLIWLNERVCCGIAVHTLFWLRSISRVNCCGRELDEKCYQFQQCNGLAHCWRMAAVLPTCLTLPVRCQPLLCVGRRLLRLPISFRRRNVLDWCCQTQMRWFYQRRWAIPSVPASSRWRCCLSNVSKFRRLTWCQPAVFILQPIR